jgi:hypothetical protein
MQMEDTVAFTWQQWLQEGATMCAVCLVKYQSPWSIK